MASVCSDRKKHDEIKILSFYIISNSHISLVIGIIFRVIQWEVITELASINSFVLPDIVTDVTRDWACYL